MGEGFLNDASGEGWLDTRPDWLEGARVTIAEIDRDDEGRLTVQYSTYPHVRVILDGAWLHVDHGESTEPRPRYRFASYPAHVVWCVKFEKPEEARATDS